MGKYARIISFVAVISIIAGMFIGCSTKKEAGVQPPNQAPANTAAATANSGGLPIVDKPMTFKYWAPFNATFAKIMTDYNGNACYQELEKRTGIKINFIHPPIGQEKDQFNLMMAANELPDIIENGATPFFTKGFDLAIEQKQIIKLNDLIDKYAPNFKKVRASNDDIRKQTVTDQGNLYGFPKINQNDEPTWYGPIVRMDWLDELGLQPPATMDEWYAMLKLFKEKKNVKSPLAFQKADMFATGSPFVGAYGVGYRFYQDGGKVKFGPMEAGYKEFLSAMKKWYAEGLIEKDFPTLASNVLDSMCTTGQAGAWVGAFGNMIDGYMPIGQKSDPKYRVSGTIYPSLKKGENVKFRQLNFRNRGFEGVITTACKNPVEAVKWFDYHYGEEGARLFDFGILGKSYDLVDGKVAARDEVLKSPDGLTFDVAQYKYKVSNAPYLKDCIMELRPQSKEIVDAKANWMKAGAENEMPPITATASEGEKMTPILNELNTYVDEMTLKFILGVEPLDKFDEFVQKVNKLGIQEVLKLKQDQLDRYNKR